MGPLHVPGNYANRFTRLLIAAALPFVTLALQLLLWDYVKPFVWFLFFPTAYIAPLIGGLWGGIVATVLSTAIVWFVFIPPQFTVAIKESPLSIVVFLAMGVVFSFFHDRMRRLGERTVREQVERQRTEATLREQIRMRELSEAIKTEKLQALQLLDTVADASNDAIFAKDSEGRYLLYNRAALRQRGLHLSEVLGRDDAELFPSDQAAQIMRRDLEIMRRGETLTYEEVLGTVFGERIFLTTKGPLRDAEGKTIGLFGIARDITARKRAEAQLAIAAVAFQSRDGMVVTDANGIILQVNRSFTEVTGYEPEEAIGKTPTLLKSGRHDAAFYRKLWQAIGHEDRWEGEIWNRRKDGGVYPEWLSISTVRNQAGEITNYLAVFSDISEPREAERKILELAFYDPLTGLPNRRLLLDRLNQALSASARNGQFGALLLLDLDHFKMLNDTRGHDSGDQLLVEVAAELRHLLRESDTAARQGGDEFVMVLEDLGALESAAAAAAETISEKLRVALGQPRNIKGDVCHITPSLGVTLFYGHRESIEGLLKQADLALYQAKNAGRNNVRFFNPTMQAAIDARAEIERGLRLALADNQLALHYQAQVLADGELIGVEALLRWQPPGQAMVAPDAFIPVAEDTGLIVPIGRWVLETACAQLAAWARAPATRHLRMAVNISARQFHQADFSDEVASVLAETGAAPDKLKLELTESLVISDIEQVIDTMEAIKRLGVSFSMDDFGTGYSSLASLKRLPLAQLKIDRSFVRNIPADADDCAIASAIISMGSALRLQVIAEGVESEAQRDFLAARGCLAYQGYLYGRPGPAASIEALAQAQAQLA